MWYSGVACRRRDLKNLSNFPRPPPRGETADVVPYSRGGLENKELSRYCRQWNNSSTNEIILRGITIRKSFQYFRYHWTGKNCFYFLADRHCKLSDYITTISHHIKYNSAGYAPAVVIPCTNENESTLAIIYRVLSML